MALTKEQFIEEIKQMSVLQLNEIVKAIEEEFGVSAAAPVVAAAPGATAAADPAAGDEAQEEKADFTVTIAEAGSNKIAVIKAVRSITELGLKEAKALVEAAPKPVKENASKEDADAAKEALEAAGAKVTID